MTYPATVYFLVPLPCCSQVELSSLQGRSIPLLVIIPSLLFNNLFMPLVLSTGSYLVMVCLPPGLPSSEKKI